ncbi:uncharacterized protein LOC18439884 isoform X3 [Amborella trichopoda]|uniref:uncharacterized protein LOC18439884 isoform X3 n=1 Tax=Amborella trichopoda TaxID=13333 RepID=UPI0009BEE0AC|nr:uncharacterized protein LOC18439884 isoform X3 [Amborella trichopoda]|eukprot:XP_020526364.1 uncharacterized protein LOC18439884 isoform X3 [Amborella trichopoda]
MDSFISRLSSGPATRKPFPSFRARWKWFSVEINGRMPYDYKHHLSSLLFRSYSQIDEINCGQPTNLRNDPEILGVPVRFLESVLRRDGISALEFDMKGVYLASTRRLGYLAVYDFQALSSGYNDNASAELLNLSVDLQLDVVRWNRANQDEVACASERSSKVFIFDIGYVSAEPSVILSKKLISTMERGEGLIGISDLTFFLNDKSRVLASGMDGVLYIWDRRMNNFPCLEISIPNPGKQLNSLELSMDEQIVYGACDGGNIYAWDLRGGRTSAAFLSHKEVYHPPLTSIKLSSLIDQITPLKEQSRIVPRAIHSINLDPSCPYQLAFSLDNGWSGVLNLFSLRVTHMHCPPPWLNLPKAEDNFILLKRKPSWLPSSSIFASASSSGKGIHLLDFHPNPSSACHVDYNEETETGIGQRGWRATNVFVSLSKEATVCAAHPLETTIIVGTKDSLLLTVSQKFESSSCSSMSSER